MPPRPRQSSRSRGCGRPSAARRAGFPIQLSNSDGRTFLVTTGLDPVVHADVRFVRHDQKVRCSVASAWIAGSSPAMTKEGRQNKNKEAERRQTQCLMSAPAGAGRATKCRLAPTLRCGRARLSAFHLRCLPGDVGTSPSSFRPGILGRGRLRMIRKSMPLDLIRGWKPVFRSDHAPPRSGVR
jgi:hypothetical protein